MNNKQPTGMKAFLVVWLGQLVSILGSSMVGFGLAVWAWEETGKATPFAMMGLAFMLPNLLFGPIAGALVDRWNRKLVMMISDVAAGATSIALLFLVSSGNMEIWHLYAANIINGFFNAFQWPAYSAAITTMVSKEQYARTSGLMSIAQIAPNIIAPGIAALLLGAIGLEGLFVLDIVTFTFAVGALVFVYIPQPKPTAEGEKGKGSLLRETAYGFQYILERPSLLGLQMVFFFGNFLASFAQPVFVPMIMARSGGNELVLGGVQTALGVGGLAGGILLSVWGGPKRRVHGVLLGWMISGLGVALIGLGQGPVVWAAGAFIMIFTMPFINGSNQALWQSKVAPDVQGRVFAVRKLIAQISAPVAMALAGPLADNFMGPAMLEGGSLTGVFGWLVGIGAGAGMALIIFISGLTGVVVGVAGYLIPSIRNVEDILPDHGQDALASQEESEQLADAEPEPAPAD